MHPNGITRRDWLKAATAAGMGMGAFSGRPAFGQDQPAPIDIGARRELFIDRFLDRST